MQSSKPKSVQHKNKQSTASNDHLKNVNGRNQRKSSVDGFLCHQISTYRSTCRRISACSTASAGDTALLLSQMFAAGCPRRENFIFLLSCVILLLFFFILSLNFLLDLGLIKNIEMYICVISSLFVFKLLPWYIQVVFVCYSLLFLFFLRKKIYYQENQVLRKFHCLFFTVYFLTNHCGV
jgi:hypothetical protein